MYLWGPVQSWLAKASLLHALWVQSMITRDHARKFKKYCTCALRDCKALCTCNIWLLHQLHFLPGARALHVSVLHYIHCCQVGIHILTWPSNCRTFWMSFQVFDAIASTLKVCAYANVHVCIVLVCAYGGGICVSVNGGICKCVYLRLRNCYYALNSKHPHACVHPWLIHCQCRLWTMVGTQPNQMFGAMVFCFGKRIHTAVDHIQVWDNPFSL